MSTTSTKSYHILVASYTDSVATLQFTEHVDSHSQGTLTQVSSTPVPGKNPSWLTAHPDRSQGSYVFACLEESDGKIVVLKYGDDGRGEVVAKSELVEGSQMHSPCHMATDREGTSLFVANYMSGSVSKFSVSLQPPVPRLTRHEDIVLPKDSTGTNKERQESPHAHQVVYFDDSKELWVSDLGSDKVWRYGVDGKLKEPSFSFPSGSGPRNLVLHPRTQRVFTVLELSSELATHVYPGEEKPVTIATTRSTEEKSMLAAAILVPKTSLQSKEALIYVSNRNDPHPEGDTIAIFSFNGDSDKLEKLGEYRTGLNHTRGMIFLGEDERYVVAGGQNNNTVKVLERVDAKDGFFREVAKLEVASPTGFLAL